MICEPTLFLNNLYIQLLSEIIKRQKLIVANGLVVCQGTITQKRVTTQRTEESAISFVLISEDLVSKIENVVIDEERNNVLTRITKTKKGIVTKESNHNVIKTTLKLSWNKTIQLQGRLFSI